MQARIGDGVHYDHHLDSKTLILSPVFNWHRTMLLSREFCIAILLTYYWSYYYVNIDLRHNYHICYEHHLFSQHYTNTNKYLQFNCVYARCKCQRMAFHFIFSSQVLNSSCSSDRRQLYWMWITQPSQGLPWVVRERCKSCTENNYETERYGGRYILSIRTYYTAIWSSPL